MSHATPAVSIVIPVYNEEAHLEELLTRCLASSGSLTGGIEIILVDDGSRDRSPELAARAAEAHPGVVISVQLNRNYGQHAAVMAGLAQARGDVVVTLDADLQNPPEEIPRLVATLLERDVDVVGTIRVPRNDSWFRRAASTITNKVVRSITGVEMHDYGCMLRAYRRHIVRAMLECHERSTFIPVLANTFAHRTAEIEVQHANRESGASRYGFWRLLNLEFDLLTSMTTFPLRLLSAMGTAIAAAGVGLGVLLFVMRLIHGSDWAVNGVFTLFAVLFVFVGLQFIGMGLLGEYVGRIYQDVRARPRYFVARVVSASDQQED